MKATSKWEKIPIILQEHKIENTQEHTYEDIYMKETVKLY